MRAGLRPTRSRPGARVRQNGVELPTDGRVVDGKAGQGRRRCGRPSAASRGAQQNLQAATEKEQQGSFLQRTHGWVGRETVACRPREEEPRKTVPGLGCWRQDLEEGADGSL